MASLRKGFAAVAFGAAIAFGSTVASAATEITYSLAGVETGFTDTSSSFAGFASSEDGDRAFWETLIERTAFDEDRNAEITGGSFRLDGRLRNLAGDVVRGTIVNRTSTCRKETFIVKGDIALVDGGSGKFRVILRHYRTRIFGQCVTYSATVEGTVTFTLP